MVPGLFLLMIVVITSTAAILSSESFSRRNNGQRISKEGQFVWYSQEGYSMITFRLFRCTLPFGSCFCKNTIGECFVSHCMSVHFFTFLLGRADPQADHFLSAPRVEVLGNLREEGVFECHFRVEN